MHTWPTFGEHFRALTRDYQGSFEDQVVTFFNATGIVGDMMQNVRLAIKDFLFTKEELNVLQYREFQLDVIFLQLLAIAGLLMVSTCLVLLVCLIWKVIHIITPPKVNTTGTVREQTKETEERAGDNVYFGQWSEANDNCHNSNGLLIFEDKQIGSGEGSRVRSVQDDFAVQEDSDAPIIMTNGLREVDSDDDTANDYHVTARDDVVTYAAEDKPPENETPNSLETNVDDATAFGEEVLSVNYAGELRNPEATEVHDQGNDERDAGDYDDVATEDFNNDCLQNVECEVSSITMTYKINQRKRVSEKQRELDICSRVSIPTPNGSGENARHVINRDVPYGCPEGHVSQAENCWALGTLRRSATRSISGQYVEIPIIGSFSASPRRKKPRCSKYVFVSPDCKSNTQPNFLESLERYNRKKHTGDSKDTAGGKPVNLIKGILKKSKRMRGDYARQKTMDTVSPCSLKESIEDFSHIRKTVSPRMSPGMSPKLISIKTRDVCLKAFDKSPLFI